jgi:RHS repeat-associated protein
MIQPGRKFSATGGYRYGFNGKEKSDEIASDNYDFGARIYDGRIGRWLSTDPVIKAFIAPYQFASNTPTNMADPDGADEIHFYYITIGRWVPMMIWNKNTNKLEDRSSIVYTTEKAISVIKNNEKDRFFVHNLGKTSKPATIEFYPNIEGGYSKSGATYSSWFLWSDTKDTDGESLKKLIDEFPSIRGLVLPDEITSANASRFTNRAENRRFWQGFYDSKRTQAEINKEKETVNNGMLAVAEIALTEFALYKLFSATTKGVTFYRAMSNAEYSALEKSGGLNYMAGTELFVSTRAAYSSSYLTKAGYDVLVKFNMKPGAMEYFNTVGVYHRTTLGASGWAERGNLLLKIEKGTLNLGIQKNTSMFNQWIQNYEKIKF